MVSTFPVYVFAVVAALLFILISAIISNSIKYEGGSNPKDPRKRKVWFWILGIISPFAHLFSGVVTFYYPENNEYAKSQLIFAIAMGAAITFVLYVVLGFILSKIFKNGKLGNWF